MAVLKVVFAEERKEQILGMLARNDKVYVQELSEIFHVSGATIRNDLNEMEKADKLVRTHGGAISVSSSSLELKSEEKKSKNQSKKSKVAEAALKYIEDGDTILLDTGTTALELAKLLYRRSHLTVMTNDLEIALILENVSGINVILIGGMIRQGFHCTVGMFAHNLLKDVTVDKAFIATNGLGIEDGLSTPDTSHAETKKLMIKCAREAYLICDSSKVGRRSFARFADLNDFICMITDDELEEEALMELSAFVNVCTVG